MSDRSPDSDVDLDDQASGVAMPGSGGESFDADRPPAGPVPEEDSPEPAAPVGAEETVAPAEHRDDPADFDGLEQTRGEGSASDEPQPSGKERAPASDAERGHQNRADDVGVLEKERDEYLDALRRLQADFDNFRKRMVRQQTETLERAAEDLVSKLLPVLDAVDAARQHGAGEGVEQIGAALFDALSKEGLERLGEEGEMFDPNIHEAVAHEEAEGGEGPKIAQVMRPGYRWRQRLLRAAMVTVKG